MGEAIGWSKAATMEVREGSGKGVLGEVKNGGNLINKQGQRRDVWTQHSEVPEGGVTTSRRWDPTLRRSRETINLTSRRYREW